MGPQLISRLLDLNETQESILTLVFEFADNDGMLLVDLNDLRTTLEYLGEHGKEMGVGEALVSTLQKKGVPAPVERVLVRPPHSRMGSATKKERDAIRKADRNMKLYAKAIDPRSAHEILRERVEANLKKQEQAAKKKRTQTESAKRTTSKPKPRKSSTRESSTDAFFKSMARSLGTAIGGTADRKFLRGVLGSLLK
jgi:hypothetical protein